jgi:hypothetical protein
MAVERIDYYSDEEYQFALAQEEYENRWAYEEEEYRRYLAEIEAPAE